MSSSNQVWSEIPGLSGYYEASNNGQIRSVHRMVNGFSAKAGRPIKLQRKEKVLSQNVRGRGYLYVCICVDGRMWKEQVHKLVLMAFKGERPDGMVACHNDGNPSNNNIENLRWGTPKENTADMKRHGTLCFGEKVKTAKLNRHQVMEIVYSRTFSEVKGKIPVSKTQYYRVKRGESWAHLSSVSAQAK